MKEADSKDNILYDSTSVTFWNRKMIGTGDRSVLAGGACEW